MEISSPPQGLELQFDAIFTPEANKFVFELVSEFQASGRKVCSKHL